MKYAWHAGEGLAGATIDTEVNGEKVGLPGTGIVHSGNRNEHNKQAKTCWLL